jgi:hypothetical protein
VRFYALGKTQTRDTRFGKPPPVKSLLAAVSPVPSDRSLGPRDTATVAEMQSPPLPTSHCSTAASGSSRFGTASLPHGFPFGNKHYDQVVVSYRETVIQGSSRRKAPRHGADYLKVLHVPPPGTFAGRKPMGIYVGSSLVQSMVDRRQPAQLERRTRDVRITPF